MNRYLLISLIIARCVLNVSNSQAQSKIDSLQLELKKATSDSSKIIALIELSSAYQFTDISKSLDLADEAINLANKTNRQQDKAKAFRNKGTLEGIRGDFASAIKYTDLSLNIFFQLKDSLGVAICYNNLGTNYYGLGKFDEAYFYHTQSYRIGNAINNRLQRAVSLHNIATVFKELGQYSKAFDYFNLSLKLSKEINDLEAEPYYYGEIGEMYIKKNQYDSALQALQLSLAFARKVNLKFNELEPRVLANIARTYLKLNDPTNALRYYDSAASLYIKTDNNFGRAEVEMGKGLLFMQEKKYDDAQKLIEKSASIAHEINAMVLEIECYENLSTLLEQKGDFKKSLSYFKQSQQLKDGLFSQGMQAKLLQDQIRFETESKEEQIKALTRMEDFRKEQIRKQQLIRNILVVVIALTLILLFSVYRSGQRRIRINKLLMEHQEEVKKRSVELEQLNQVKDKFFSIISHDLRSPINALTGILDLMDKNEITPTEFSMLNKELRIQFNHTKTLINNLLDWTLLQMDKLKIQMEKIDLTALVESNIKLLSSLHLKEIKIVSRILPASFAIGDTNMINLVLRNLLTNAIKFSEAGGTIEVNATEKADHFIVSVKDYGVGITPEIQKILFEKTTGYSTRGTANEKGTGLGLILCKEFVERNDGKIWLESELGKGSTFYFSIKKEA
jgi:signal transduction histidine kinase